MTELDKIAYHEAGHLVFGVANFFGEPDYPPPISISIERTDNSLGKVKGLSYYEGYTFEENETMAGYPKYPSYNELQKNPIELIKLKKEAIQEIGGLMAEHLCCQKPAPTFKNDEPKYASDLWKYTNALKKIDGFFDNLSADITSEEIDVLELKLYTNYWDSTLEKVKKKPEFMEALELVKNELITHKTINGVQLDALVLKVKTILNPRPPKKSCKTFIKKHFPFTYSIFFVDDESIV